MNSRMNTARAALSSFIWASLWRPPPARGLSADLQSDPIAEACAQEHIGRQYATAQQSELLGECGWILGRRPALAQRRLHDIDQSPVEQRGRSRPERGP